MTRKQNGQTKAQVVNNNGKGVETTVAAIISNLGHVTIYVASKDAKTKRGRIASDVVEIDIPKVHIRGEFGVKQYVKPNANIAIWGYRPPPIWPRTHEVPVEVLEILRSAYPELIAQLGQKDTQVIAEATTKIGLFDVEIATPMEFVADSASAVTLR